MKHLVTIDVESVCRGRGDGHADADPQLAPALTALLDLLRQHKTTATFFVLGADALAVRPVLAQALVDGHAIACHGDDHQRIDCIAPSSLPTVLRDARRRIEDIFQISCCGFRAPYFSVHSGMDCFFSGLAEAGFTYDASLRLPLGTPVAQFTERFGIREIPVPLVRRGGMTLGVLGGLALRVLPIWYICRLVDTCERAGQPACIYLHPYEWYSRPEFSRITMSEIRRTWLTARTLARLELLLRCYQCAALDEQPKRSVAP